MNTRFPIIWIAMFKTHSTEQIVENIKRQFVLPRTGSPLINFSGGFHFFLFIVVTVVLVHCFFFAFLFLFTLLFLLTLFVLFRPTFSVFFWEGKLSRMVTSILQLNTAVWLYFSRLCNENIGGHYGRLFFWNTERKLSINIESFCTEMCSGDFE